MTCVRDEVYHELIKEREGFLGVGYDHIMQSVLEEYICAIARHGKEGVLVTCVNGYYHKAFFTKHDEFIIHFSSCLPCEKIDGMRKAMESLALTEQEQEQEEWSYHQKYHSEGKFFEQEEKNIVDAARETFLRKFGRRSKIGTPKTPLYLLMDQDHIDIFKRIAEQENIGYQTKIKQILKDWIKDNS